MLNKFLSLLESRENSAEEYFIPKSWNYVNMPSEDVNARSGEIRVNPYRFYGECIRYILNCKNADVSDFTVLYTMLPRTFSAWRHKNDETIMSGTFLKSLCLLPLLKKMGINTICLLPVFLTGEANKKGELGSPYAIRDIMRIDSDLHDPLLQGFTPEDEFRAFAQACRLLGIKLLLDFVFRTVSRDNVLIEEHPDWFYWIKSDFEKNFTSPEVENVGHCVITPEIARKMYQADSIKDYIGKFVLPPDFDEWERAKSFARENDVSVFDYWTENKGELVVPGFADTINDPQPPWTDITFPKFYFQQSNIANECLAGFEYAPFIAQDGVKCSVCHSTQPNEELWRFIEDIIPYYIEQYSIDGARIDMAHALPRELNERIIEKIKSTKPDFILWSEEFFVKNSAKAKKEGYSFITGGIWDLWDKTKQDSFNASLLECLDSELPVLSALEMADTPRSAFMLGRDELRAMLFLTALLPNTVFMVNNAQELAEIQPMNLGLKNTEDGKYVLSPEHPLYGKLAFFDNYYFNWTASAEHASLISEALRIRKSFKNDLFRNENFRFDLLKNTSELTVISCIDEKEGFIAFFNRGENKKDISLNEYLDRLGVSDKFCTPLYSEKATQNCLEADGFVIFRITVD